MLGLNAPGILQLLLPQHRSPPGIHVVTLHAQAQVVPFYVYLWEVAVILSQPCVLSTAHWSAGDIANAIGYQDMIAEEACAFKFTMAARLSWQCHCLELQSAYAVP